MYGPRDQRVRLWQSRLQAAHVSENESRVLADRDGRSFFLHDKTVRHDAYSKTVRPRPSEVPPAPFGNESVRVSDTHDAIYGENALVLSHSSRPIAYGCMTTERRSMMPFGISPGGSRLIAMQKTGDSTALTPAAPLLSSGDVAMVPGRQQAMGQDIKGARRSERDMSETITKNFTVPATVALTSTTWSTRVDAAPRLVGPVVPDFLTEDQHRQAIAADLQQLCIKSIPIAIDYEPESSSPSDYSKVATGARDCAIAQKKTTASLFCKGANAVVTEASTSDTGIWSDATLSSSDRARPFPQVKNDAALAVSPWQFSDKHPAYEDLSRQSRTHGECSLHRAPACQSDHLALSQYVLCCESDPTLTQTGSFQDPASAPLFELTKSTTNNAALQHPQQPPHAAEQSFSPCGFGPAAGAEGILEAEKVCSRMRKQQNQLHLQEQLHQQQLQQRRRLVQQHQLEKQQHAVRHQLMHQQQKVERNNLRKQQELEQACLHAQLEEQLGSRGEVWSANNQSEEISNCSDWGLLQDQACNQVEMPVKQDGFVRWLTPRSHVENSHQSERRWEHQRACAGAQICSAPAKGVCGAEKAGVEGVKGFSARIRGEHVVGSNRNGKKESPESCKMVTDESDAFSSKLCISGARSSNRQSTQSPLLPRYHSVTGQEVQRAGAVRTAQKLEVPTQLMSKGSVDHSVSVSVAGEQLEKQGPEKNSDESRATGERRSPSTGAQSARSGSEKAFDHSEVCPQAILEGVEEEEKFVLHLAILTLYKDQIKPRQFEVKHRLQELHCSPFCENNFPTLYRAIPALYWVDSDPVTKHVTVYLRCAPDWFKGWVDMRDPENPYPLGVWSALDEYIRGLLEDSEASGNSERARQQGLAPVSSRSSGQGHSATSNAGSIKEADQSERIWASRECEGDAPQRARREEQKSEPAWRCKSGRYGFAKKLQAKGLPTIRSYSLGQICHMVQLAVHFNALTYENGFLIPAACSVSLIRSLHRAVGPAANDEELSGKQERLSPSRPWTCEVGVETTSPSNFRSATDPLEEAASKVFCDGCPEPSSGINDTGEATVSPSGIEAASKQSYNAQSVITSLDEVQRCMKLLLDENKPVLLSQLKFRVFHKFKRRLDPLVFGFARLSDFLTDRCQPVCRLVREGGRQVLVEKPLLGGAPPTQGARACEGSHGAFLVKDDIRSSPSRQACSTPKEVSIRSSEQEKDREDFDGKPEGTVSAVCEVACQAEGNVQAAEIESRVASPKKGEHLSMARRVGGSLVVPDAQSRTSRGVFAILSRRRRFHASVSYSYWQYVATHEASVCKDRGSEFLVKDDPAVSGSLADKDDSDLQLPLPQRRSSTNKSTGVLHSPIHEIDDLLCGEVVGSKLSSNDLIGETLRVSSESYADGAFYAPLEDSRSFGSAVHVQDSDLSKLSRSGDRGEDIECCSNTVSQHLCFGSAGRFMDFLFATVLRPTSTEPPAASGQQARMQIGTHLTREGVAGLSKPNVDGSTWDIDPRTLMTLEGPKRVMCASYGVSDHGRRQQLQQQQQQQQTFRSSRYPQCDHQILEVGMYTPPYMSKGGLRWFTRKPLICRQLGVSEESLTLRHSEDAPSSLEEVFYSVLPPRLPLVAGSASAHHKSKEPRPSKLRRLVSAQIVALHQGAFSCDKNTAPPITES